MTTDLTEQTVRELCDGLLQYAPTAFAKGVEELRYAALRDVRARRQKPMATKLVSDPYDERDGSWFSAADLQRIHALPVGTSLYASPQPTYRDGLLAAAKHFETEVSGNWTSKRVAGELRLLAEKEKT